MSVSLISTDSARGVLGVGPAPLASRGLPDQGQGIRTRKYEKTFVHMLAYNFIDRARSSSLFVKSETTAFERFTSGKSPGEIPPQVRAKPQTRPIDGQSTTMRLAHR